MLDEPIVVKLCFVRGVPIFDALFEGNLLTQRHKICPQETRDSRLSQGEDPESLSHLGLIWYRVVTDRQTNGWTDGQNYDS